MSAGPPAESGADSAGQGWTGRRLPPTPFAGDSGAADAVLAAALDAHAVEAGPQSESAVVAALGPARVFAAVVALGDEHGSGADMAMVTVTGRDGRRLLPGFTTTDRLTRWRPDARPVPIRGRDLAGAARAEGCELLGLDLADEGLFLVRRPALDALRAGGQWTPPAADPEVRAAVVAVSAAAGAVCRIEAGGTSDPGAELRVTVGLPPGLPSAEVARRLAQIQAGLAADPLVATRVDSVAIAVRTR